MAWFTEIKNFWISQKIIDLLTNLNMHSMQFNSVYNPLQSQDKKIPKVTCKFLLKHLIVNAIRIYLPIN